MGAVKKSGTPIFYKEPMADQADICRITGACAVCGREGIPGTDFVESMLVRFLDEQTSRRGRSEFVDVRGDVRTASKTQVAGADLRCRSCVLAARDAHEERCGRHWDTTAQPFLFEQRPFGFQRAPFFLCGFKDTERSRQ